MRVAGLDGGTSAASASRAACTASGARRSRTRCTEITCPREPPAASASDSALRRASATASPSALSATSSGVGAGERRAVDVVRPGGNGRVHQLAGAVEILGVHRDGRVRRRSRRCGGRREDVSVESEMSCVWMSLPSTPASFMAFVTFSIAAAAAESASLAVSPRASTPKVNVASSGVVVTVDEPLTVIERIGPELSGSESADQTKSGRPTPATAAATRTSRATAAIRTGRMASSVDAGPRTYAAGPACVTSRLGGCPGEAEVRAPPVRDLRRGQVDEEHRSRRARRRAQLHPRLLRASGRPSCGCRARTR